MQKLNSNHSIKIITKIKRWFTKNLLSLNYNVVFPGETGITVPRSWTISVPGEPGDLGDTVPRPAGQELCQEGRGKEYHDHISGLVSN